jgi:hypothetical protein
VPPVRNKIGAVGRLPEEVDIEIPPDVEEERGDAGDGSKLDERYVGVMESHPLDDVISMFIVRHDPVTVFENKRSPNAAGSVPDK